MIGSLRGEVLDWSPTEALLEVGGIGYRIQATPATLAGIGEVGSVAFLHIHHQVREDAETLYGFTTIDDRRVFEVLIGTHGVGPALALSILSVHSPAGLRQVVGTDDVAALCLVPGVGRKTAARLLVELKSRLDVPHGANDAVIVTASDGPSARSDVRDALAGLGYGPDEIARVLLTIPEEGESSDLLREALVRLAAA
jgi:Holliday junction DNA helicase RuvA